MWTNLQVPAGTSILTCSNMVPETVYTYEVVFFSSGFEMFLSFIYLFIDIVLSRYSEK